METYYCQTQVPGFIHTNSRSCPTRSLSSDTGSLDSRPEQTLKYSLSEQKSPVFVFVLDQTRDFCSLKLYHPLTHHETFWSILEQSRTFPNILHRTYQIISNQTVPYLYTIIHSKLLNSHLYVSQTISIQLQLLSSYLQPISGYLQLFSNLFPV